jgi:hypothetical protein
MLRKLLSFLAALLALSLVSNVLASQARDLTFEERVQAQEATERVYYSHQVGATKPFEVAVPSSVIEDEVRKARPAGRPRSFVRNSR